MIADNYRSTTGGATTSVGQITLIAMMPFEGNRDANVAQYQPQKLVSLSDFDGSGCTSAPTNATIHYCP